MITVLRKIHQLAEENRRLRREVDGHGRAVSGILVTKV